MKNRIFHTATINGECFYGLTKSDGLYVVLKRTGGNAPIGEAELEVVIEFLKKTSLRKIGAKSGLMAKSSA